MDSIIWQAVVKESKECFQKSISAETFRFCHWRQREVCLILSFVSNFKKLEWTRKRQRHPQVYTRRPTCLKPRHRTRHLWVSPTMGHPLEQELCPQVRFRHKLIVICFENVKRQYSNVCKVSVWVIGGCLIVRSNEVKYSLFFKRYTL